MSFDKPIIQTSNPNKQDHASLVRNRTIYYGEVINIDDETDGGVIKVRIPELDNRTGDSDLPDCYPLQPKFFHLYPQVGEMVRIFVQDLNLPERSRFWVGPIISQPQKIGFDSRFSALSTTNLGLTKPLKAPSTYPDADGVYPTKVDVAIVGKVNTDIILKVNELHLRAGKHDNNDPLTLNVKNPAHIGLIYEPLEGTTEEFYSNTIIQSDKIALITHDGNPKFKAARMTSEDRVRVFTEGHPLARADVLIEALEVIRVALLTHIHPYSGLPVDKTALIKKLEELQFETILQKNIVTN
jgi:hypothetical protein